MISALRTKQVGKGHLGRSTKEEHTIDDEGRLLAHHGMSQDQELEPGSVHLHSLLDMVLDLAVAERFLGKHRPLQ
jgi:hypothetical protein